MYQAVLTNDITLTGQTGVPIVLRTGTPIEVEPAEPWRGCGMIAKYRICGLPANIHSYAFAAIKHFSIEVLPEDITRVQPH